jgi:hypothetical protein
MSACCSNFGSNKCRCNCWPVDPRAPKVLYHNLNGKKVVIVGKNPFAQLEELMAMVPPLSEKFIINPIELAKIELDELVVKEENSRFSGKVTQRDQRNRERFNKNRKWK